MRATYRVLAGLIALGVVVQAAFIAAGWFQVLHDTDDGSVFDKNTGYNWAQVGHGTVGMIVIPLLSIILLIVSFFARIPGGVKWALITFGVVVLQILLAILGFGAPVVGLLHGLNAFAVAAVASIAMRKARVAEQSAPAVQPAPIA
jgi:heme A synthase